MGQDGTREFGRRSVVSVMNWIGTLIVLAIPGVNLIMLFVWAITCKRASKRNFCIAVLVLTLIAVALSLALVAVYGDVIATWIEGLDAQWLTNPLATAAATPTPSVLPSATPTIAP